MSDDAKTCKACGESKPLSEFHMHPSTADRREGKCKDCRRIERAKHTPHGMPQCDVCHEMKPIRAFPRSASANWAYGSTCKACCITQFASKGKQCIICHGVKPLTMFHKHPKTFDGFAGECKECVRVKNHASHLRIKYDITREEYDALYVAQNGVCAICGETGRIMGIRRGARKRAPRVFTASLFVDHDHTSGKVRALLCNDCNFGLGAFRESVDLLQTAIEYLALYRAKEEAS